jgi:hypothetical protein
MGMVVDVAEETRPPRAHALGRLAMAFSPWSHLVWFGVFFCLLALGAWGGLSASDPIAARLGDDDYSHWIAFGALGAIAATYPSWRGRAIAYGIVCVLAFALEVAQELFAAGRGASLSDVANSLIGAGGGFSAIYAGVVMPILRAVDL